MKVTLSTAALALALASIWSPGASARAYAASGAGYQISWPWDQPPPEFKEVQQQGFHAGVKAAIKDYDKHRDPDAMRHKEFVHPHVDRSMREDYRKGFQRGYDDAMHHLVKTHGEHS